MGLKDIQDQARESGWRIQSIPWQTGNKAELVYNTPLSGAMALAGVALFLGPIILILRQSLPPWTIVISIAGLALAVLSRVVAARTKYRGWIPVDAIVLDREHRKRKRRRKGKGGKTTTVWSFRLLCRFDYQGQTYEATPECPDPTIVKKTESALKKYLVSKITPENRCRLYVDPDNPLHAVFHEIPWFA